MDQALDDDEEAEFLRQTQQALIRNANALDEDPAWERTLRDGLERG